MNVLLAPHTLSVLCVCMMSYFSFAVEDLGEIVVFAGSLPCNAQLQSMFCLQKYGEGGRRQNSYAIMSIGKAQTFMSCKAFYIRIVNLTNCFWVCKRGLLLLFFVVSLCQELLACCKKLIFSVLETKIMNPDRM